MLDWTWQLLLKTLLRRNLNWIWKKYLCPSVFTSQGPSTYYQSLPYTRRWTSISLSVSSVSTWCMHWGIKLHSLRGLRGKEKEEIDRLTEIYHVGICRRNLKEGRRSQPYQEFWGINGRGLQWHQQRIRIKSSIDQQKLSREGYLLCEDNLAVRLQLLNPRGPEG